MSFIPDTPVGSGSLLAKWQESLLAHINESVGLPPHVITTATNATTAYIPTTYVATKPAGLFVDTADLPRCPFCGGSTHLQEDRFPGGATRRILIHRDRRFALVEPVHLSLAGEAAQALRFSDIMRGLEQLFHQCPEYLKAVSPVGGDPKPTKTTKTTKQKPVCGRKILR